MRSRTLLFGVSCGLVGEKKSHIMSSMCEEGSSLTLEADNVVGAAGLAQEPAASQQVVLQLVPAISGALAIVISSLQLQPQEGISQALAQKMLNFLKKVICELER